MKLTTKCTRCKGTGEILDRLAIGKDLRAKRLKMHIRAVDVARKLRFTKAHVALLESGQRNWTPETIERYEKVLEQSRQELLEAVQ